MIDNPDKVRSVDDCIMIYGYPAYDQDGCPTPDVFRVDTLDDGTRVRDARGEPFTIRGYGFVQGSTLVQDRYRRVYQTDSDTRVRLR